MSDHEYWKALRGPLGLDVVGYSRRADVLVEFPSGYRAGFAPEDLLSIAERYRNQVIQELIEKAKAEFLDAQKRREEMSGTSLSLRVDRAKATYEWLKAQMEGE